MDAEIYTSWTGPIICIGYGSIAQGLLPLLSRHIAFYDNQLFFIEPKKSNCDQIKRSLSTIIQTALTPENYESILSTIIKQTSEQALIINLSVDVSSVAIIEYAQQNNALYIDTVVEPWGNYYSNDTVPISQRTNYFLREELLALKRDSKTVTTAISCCGANPGMVSWLLKEALLTLSRDLGKEITTPHTQNEWAQLMYELDVKGVHIAERDTQTAHHAKGKETFVNTWSVDGLIAESLQPAELGWGTHEKTIPLGAHTHTTGSKCALYLDAPGGLTKIKSWVPSGPQDAYLITHNEAISISDYFTLRGKENEVLFRPTCHYAYHPSPATIDSLEELFTFGATSHTVHKILSANEISSGSDELGVLLYGHAKNVYWYGSTLSIEEARKLAPNQNATGLQVSSSVLAGIIWMIKNPNQGIVEAEEIDYKFCLDLQRKYLGKIVGFYTDWYPAPIEVQLTEENKRWQFSDIQIKGI